MPISLNQDVSFVSPDEIVVGGGVTSTEVATEIVVSVNDAEGAITTLNGDGTWSATVSLDGSTFSDIDAVVRYSDGTSETSNDLEIVKGIPLDNQSVSELQQNDGSFSATVYGPNGRGLYDVLEVPDGEGGFTNVIGRGGPKIAYTDFQDNFEEIENFRPGGPRHDTLNLSDTSLQTLAQVLHHTTMSDGSATIHIDPQTSVTLDGVTKQQLAANHQDFVFVGGHTLAP